MISQQLFVILFVIVNNKPDMTFGENQSHKIGNTTDSLDNVDWKNDPFCFCLNLINV